MVAFTFLAFDRKHPFKAKMVKKNENCQFKVFCYTQNLKNTKFV